MSCSVGSLLTPSNLLENCGANTAVLRTGVLLILSFQVMFQNDYVPAPDYASETDATNLFFRGLYQLSSQWWNVGFYQFYPDNACTRTINKSPLTFDFIILGGGTAGLTLARQLLNNTKNWKILVVEAGFEPRTESIVPQFFPFNINNTNTWNYTAQVVNGSSNAFKLGAPMQFGRQLGGSSGTNAMFYVVGNNRDYDKWAAMGNTGWGYNDILPYVKKSEGNTDPSIVQNGTYHGTAGNLTVTTYPNDDPFIPFLQNAYVDRGYPVLNDYNAGKYIGFVKLQGTTRGGERMTSYRAFITPVKNNTNLYIMKNSLAVKILFTGKKATSVLIQTNQTNCPNITVTSTKEIIVSAGALGSPQILQRSGIGRAADLASLGITQVADLNVGNNLMDHVYAALLYTINPNATMQTTIDVALQGVKYLTNRSGEFAALGITNAEGFIDTLNVNGTYPDIQITPYRFPKNQIYFTEVLTNFGYKDKYIKYLVDLNANFEILLLYVIVTQPYSRGSIKINSLDPKAKPTIVSGYYTDPRDIDTQIRGIRKVLDLMNSTALSSTQPSLINFDIEECNSIVPATSDDYWKCYIKYFSLGEWHPSGTCKMGNSTDTGAVVDPTLKVYNITGLRVVDNSIIPMIPAANTQATAYMIGQKAADMVKLSWP